MQDPVGGEKSGAKCPQGEYSGGEFSGGENSCYHVYLLLWEYKNVEKF